jgi:esterase/lipase
MTAVMQFMRLVHDLKPELARVQVPTMVVQGGLDPVIHPHSSTYIMRKLGGEKELHVYPKARHLICMDAQCSHLFADVEQFLSKT